MGFFGDLFSGAASAGLGLLGQYMNVGYQKELQEHAGAVNYKYAEKTARNQPTWNRAGLESAGYNPMLAVQNATSGANAGWTSTGQANPVDLSQSIANAVEVQRIQNETEQTKSTVGLQSQQAQTEQAKRQNLDFQNAMLDVEKHLKQKDLDTYDERFYTEMYRMMQEAEKMRQEASVVGYNAESARIVANAHTEQARAANISANAAKSQAETSAKWTPVGIGAGLGAGALGFALGKFKNLKYLKKAKVGFRT